VPYMRGYGTCDELSPSHTLKQRVDLDPKIRWDLDTDSTAIETLAETLKERIEKSSMIGENDMDKVSFLRHMHTRIAALESMPGPSLY
jgi:hypothetical protein